MTHPTPRRSTPRPLARGSAWGRRAFGRLTLGLLALAVAGGAYASGAMPATAAPAGTTYEGKTNDNSPITLITGADGTVVTNLTMPSSGVDGCSFNLVTGNLRLSSSDTFYVGTAELKNGAESHAYFGAFGDAGTAIGAIGFDWEPGAQCSGALRRTYIATSSGGDGVQGPGATAGTYTGTVLSVMPDEGVRGTVEIVVGADGRSVDSLHLTYTDGACVYRPTLEATALLDGKILQTGVRTIIGSAAIPSIVATTQGTSRIVGAFSTPAEGACPPVGGYWTADLATPAPTPAPAPSGSGRFVTTPVFSPAGQAFAIFGGGASGDVEAAAREAHASGVWAQDASGAYQLLVVDGPPFLNAAFHAAFAGGLATNTSLTLTR